MSGGGGDRYSAGVSGFRLSNRIEYWEYVAEWVLCADAEGCACLLSSCCVLNGTSI